jgi:hypothetical protein
MTIDASRPMSRIPNCRSLLLAGLMLIAPAGTGRTNHPRLRRFAVGGLRHPPGRRLARLARQTPAGKKLDYSVVNASISGETTSGGRTRIDAALARHSPQVVIIALGANDGLRGLPVANNCATT